MSIRRSKEYSPNRKNVKSLSDDLSFYKLTAISAKNWKREDVLLISVSLLITTSFDFIRTKKRLKEWHSIGTMNFSSPDHLPLLEGRAARTITIVDGLHRTKIAYQTVIKPNIDSVQVLFDSMRE